MKTFILSLSLISFTMLFGCEKSSNETNNQNQNIMSLTDSTSKNNLIGKKALLIYPEFTAEVTYLSDKTLHWETTTKDGKNASGDEDIFYKQLNDYLFFINWIEKDGLTISQVIDTKLGKVTAYASFSDENSPRGKRNNMVLNGTFEFID